MPDNHSQALGTKVCLMNEELKPARRKVPDKTEMRHAHLPGLRTFLCLLTVFLSGTWGSLVHAGSWGSVTKKLSIQQGTQAEAWESDRLTNGTTVTRGDVTWHSRPARGRHGGRRRRHILAHRQSPAQRGVQLHLRPDRGQTYYDTITGSKGNIIVSTSATQQLSGGPTAYTGS